MMRPNHSVEDVGGWFLAEGQMGKSPMLLRGRVRLGELREHALLPTRLTVVWTLAAPGNAGLPERAESASLEAFEHAVVAALERDCMGILTMVLTHGGARTWTFYVNDVAETRRRLDEVMSAGRAWPIEISSADDPTWEEYRTMITDTGVSAD
ncbi:MAG TPA: DUF695 domain-containing protein [Polyangiaceae bacterium]|nr:DUF695 domain-containing protein [Polyangiaceae bacterium]